MLKPHNTLEEAISARHVIRMQSSIISNQYWEWCSIHIRPFCSIALNSPGSRYAIVELDLYGLSAGGLDQEAGREILQNIQELKLRPGSSFMVSPVYISAFVEAKSAKSFAFYLYRKARQELSIDQITHEEWLKGDREHKRNDICKKNAFAPISGIARPLAIKDLRDDYSLFI